MSTPILKVEFISLNASTSLAAYLAEWEAKQSEFGGKTLYRVNIDQYFVGEAMAYSTLLIDEFPDSEAALQCDQSLAEAREQHLGQRYAMLVRNRPAITRRIKRLHGLSSLFSFFTGAGKEKPLPDLETYTRSAISPTLKTIEELRTHDQDRPVFMMNLNKFYTEAQYGDGKKMSGEKAYEEYAKSMFPYMIAVKGYPVIFGKVIQVIEQDSSASLPAEWDEFLLVSYPSRKHFMRLLTNAPQKGVKHRNAGLEQSLVLPCSVLQE